MAAKEEKKLIVTPQARASFPNIFNVDDNGKFSISLLFAEDADLAEMHAAVERAIVEKWGNKRPKKLEMPFKNQGEKEYDGYVDGCVYISVNANRDYPPSVYKRIEGANVKITDPREIYGGCFVKASVNVYAWEFKNEKGAIMKQGVSFGLYNVLKTRDGDRFGGGSDSGGSEFGGEVDANDFGE